MVDANDEDIDFEVAWNVKITAPDIETAANRAEDLMRSRMPVSLTISFSPENDGHMVSQRCMPSAEENIKKTLQRFLPRCEVVCFYDEEGVEVNIGSNMFKEIPNDEDRKSFVTLIFSSLPPEESDRMFFNCYTLDEWEEVAFDEEEEEVGAVPEGYDPAEDPRTIAPTNLK